MKSIILVSMISFAGFFANADVTLHPGGQAEINGTIVTCAGSRHGGGSRPSACTIGFTTDDTTANNPLYFVRQNGQQVSGYSNTMNDALADLKQLKAAGVCP